jgi:DNA-binding GntR family transcriptional regulator
MRHRAAAIQAETIADKVYSLMRQDIVSGVFRPGERIHEKRLATQMGVSRTPIREALLRLEAEGVVVCTARRSYNVRVLSVDDVREIYTTLGILEGAAAAAVVARLDAADLRELRQFNRQMATAATKADWQAFALWNRRFHEVFLLKLENRTLRDTCNLVRGPLYTFPIPRPTSLSAWMRKSVAEHRTIIRLVEEKDAQALGTYFRDVHWGYERNRHFISDAFDHNGETLKTG